MFGDLLDLDFEFDPTLLMDLLGEAGTLGEPGGYVLDLLTGELVDASGIDPSLIEEPPLASSPISTSTSDYLRSLEGGAAPEPFTGLTADPNSIASGGLNLGGLAGAAGKGLAGLLGGATRAGRALAGDPSSSGLGGLLGLPGVSLPAMDLAGDTALPGLGSSGAFDVPSLPAWGGGDLPTLGQPGVELPDRLMADPVRFTPPPALPVDIPPIVPFQPMMLPSSAGPAIIPPPGPAARPTGLQRLLAAG